MGKKKNKKKHQKSATNPVIITKAENIKEDATLSNDDTKADLNAESKAEPAASDNTIAKKSKKKDRFAFTKDIKYRGPLSYRHLKILGWVCIVLSQIVVIESLKQRYINTEPNFLTTSSFISYITNLALPLLLISVFAFLLQKRTNYRNTIIVNGLLALGIIVLFMFIYNRYILGIYRSLFHTDNSSEVASLNDIIFSDEGSKGFFAFNIFVDIFICSLIMFFIDYNPKRFFTGKKIIFFRILVALPLAYEVACVLIKIIAINHLVSIPLWVSPFLTTKPPVSILMFLSIVRYIKIQEKKYLATGRTLEEYHEYQKTNIHSLRFSKHLILIIIVYSLLDLLLMVILMASHIVLIDGITVLEANENILPIVTNALSKVTAWGMGETAPMILLVPIILLFSYTRKHEEPLIDTVIPIIAVIAIVVIYIDGIFQIFQGAIANAVAQMENNSAELGEVINALGQIKIIN
ncbi:MAG: hypothetical protein IKP88_16270 [Lachnospiraceae bacterium]|nr:hypothetical protein [Lachnospiraceae bacterium]